MLPLQASLGRWDLVSLTWPTARIVENRLDCWLPAFCMCPWTVAPSKRVSLCTSDSVAVFQRGLPSRKVPERWRRGVHVTPEKAWAKISVHWYANLAERDIKIAKLGHISMELLYNPMKLDLNQWHPFPLAIMFAFAIGDSTRIF
jgi:hypothetical protein